MPAQEHYITLEEAVEMTTEYRDNLNTILVPGYQEMGTLPICETFDKEAFSSFMENSACRSVRIYYGMKDLKVHAIMVGVDENGADMVAPAAVQLPIVERSLRNPPAEVPASVLNGEVVNG